LFIERGYDNVTVADICVAAEIAPRTFHRYFTGKDDVVAEPVRYMTSLVADRIAAAEPGMNSSQALHQAIHELGIFVVEHRDWLGALRTVIQQSPHLIATHQGAPPEQEGKLTRLLAERQEAAASTTRQGSAASQGSDASQGSGASQENAASQGSAGPDWRLRLLVACSVAAFRIWHDDYLRGAIDEPLARLDEMMTAVSRPDRDG
jgi:AcrR family transcriptional regulator